MRKIKFNLQMAGLIPDFLYQFLENDLVERQSINCLEFEDLRDSLKSNKDKELESIRRFLSIGAPHVHTGECDSGHEHEHEEEEKGADDEINVEFGPSEQLDDAMKDVDAEILEVDEDGFHAYTPGELKYAFGEIIYNIDMVYEVYCEYTGVNPIFTVGFKMKNGLEAALAVEFLKRGEKAEDTGEAFEVPIKNSSVSDDISCRVYIYYNTEKTDEYEKAFKEITDIMGVKHDDRYMGGLH
ncbi:MAG: hypothetical protein LLG37_03445 [Spirochaetia bacterium]|nr:hypothetical protein [Spirochaetia bacterium]